MKKAIYALILLLVVVSGLVYANHAAKKTTDKKSPTTPPTAAERDTEKKRWEASPDGINFKKWEASPIGQKVLEGISKISKHVKDSSNMEAVITSLSLPEGSRLGFGVMARINGEDYILSFGALKSTDYQQLQSLKVNDKVILRSKGVSYAPKYAYPIVSGDYVERDNKVIYKHVPVKGGC